MLVGQRSSILLFALALGAMFALISVSLLDIGVSSKEGLIQELQAARINTNLARTIVPERLCFTLDNEILSKYSTLIPAISEADLWAENDIRSNATYGNYYSGTTVDLDRSQMLSLLRTYNFNQTTSQSPAIDRFFSYEHRSFNCGFNYSDKYYLLTLSFTTLEKVNTEHGYVPIRLSQGLVDRSESSVTNVTTYIPFNSTAVFFNELSSPVTIDFNSNDSGISETIILLPDRMQDLYLRPNWSSLEDTNYHYEVKEYPWIEGDISVSQRYSNGCMSEEEAKSLYLERDFRVMFPSYLSNGLRLGCIATNTSNYAIQIYVNQTAIDYYKSKGVMYSEDNPYPFYLYGSMSREEVNGIVQVHAQKYYLDFENPREQGYETYQYMLNNTDIGYITNPQFIDDDMRGISYLSFNEGDYLSAVDVLTASERYRVVGAFPSDEIMKIAESLNP